MNHMYPSKGTSTPGFFPSSAYLLLKLDGYLIKSGRHTSPVFQSRDYKFGYKSPLCSSSLRREHGICENYAHVTDNIQLCFGFTCVVGAFALI